MIGEAVVKAAIGLFGKEFMEFLRKRKEQDAQNEIQRILGPGCYFKEKTVMLSDKALKTLTEYMREKEIRITLAREDSLPEKFEKGSVMFELEGYRFQWGTQIVIAKRMTGKEALIMGVIARQKVKGKGNPWC